MGASFVYEQDKWSDQIGSLDPQCGDLENEYDDVCLVLEKEVFEIGPAEHYGLEVIFVLDVSISMEDNLNKIAGAFSSLMSSIEGFQWKMAFTTADHGDHQYFFNPKTKVKSFPPPQRWEDYKGREPRFGRLMPLQLGKTTLSDKILSAGDKNYESIFQDTISYRSLDFCSEPPYCQEGHEQPLKSLQSFILREGNEQEAHFFSPHDVFVAFVLTDEGERAEDPRQAVKADEILSSFENIFSYDKRQRKKMIVHGISIQSKKCLKEQRQGRDADYSRELDRLVELTRGRKVDICDEDYSPAFAKISKDLEKAVHEIPLKKEVFTSDEISIDVRVKNKWGETLHLDWSFDEKQKVVYFPERLEPGTKIELFYFTSAAQKTPST